MAKKDCIVNINGVDYVPKESRQIAEKDGLKYCVVRTYSAGVFAGYLKSREGKEVEMVEARRLWYWDGAASLSQLAMEGVKTPQNCKFPCPVASVILTEAIEIIPATELARESIQGVAIWQK
jgi:hypothetical protein